MLTVFVILGLSSVNNALSNNNQDYGQRYLVKSETQNTLNSVLSAAQDAVGSGTMLCTTDTRPFRPLGALPCLSPVADRGILIGKQMGNNNPQSFCVHQKPGGADQWACYNLQPDHQIMMCHKDYNLADQAGYRGASAACSDLPVFVGSANSLEINFSNSQNQLSFSVTIKNSLNNDISSDAENNPEVILTGGISPLQEGI